MRFQLAEMRCLLGEEYYIPNNTLLFRLSLKTLCKPEVNSVKLITIHLIILKQTIRSYVEYKRVSNITIQNENGRYQQQNVNKAIKKLQGRTRKDDYALGEVYPPILAVLSQMCSIGSTEKLNVTLLITLQHAHTDRRYS